MQIYSPNFEKKLEKYSQQLAHRATGEAFTVKPIFTHLAMHIAILTFDGFNELDSLIAYGMLGRIAMLGDAHWKVSIASPTAPPRVCP